MNKALVLLGYSGAGKDTLVKLAQARFGSHVGNCKFGEFNKRLVASICDVPLSYMEDKHWRSTHNLMRTAFGTPEASLTPFELLTSLFVGGTSNEPHRLAYQKFTVAQAKRFQCPVFTDIRHRSELTLVQQEFETSVVFISCKWLQPSVNDTYIDELASDASYQWLTRSPDHTPQQTFETLLEMNR